MKDGQNIVGVIPARWASQRFPGKPLARVAGLPMVVRVWQQASRAQALAQVVVATDDERIARTATEAGARVLMTRPDHPTGTDRLLEALQYLPEATHLVNIQGDEPYIEPEDIDRVCALLTGTAAEPELATLVRPLTDPQRLHDPNCIKVVVQHDGVALYFSRAALPFQRGCAPQDWLNHHRYWQHIGIYGYSRAALHHIAGLPVSDLEQAESLEQLRWLQAGLRIRTAVTLHESDSVDTPEDLERLHRRLGYTSS